MTWAKTVLLRFFYTKVYHTRLRNAPPQSMVCPIPYHTTVCLILKSSLPSIELMMHTLWEKNSIIVSAEGSEGMLLATGQATYRPARQRSSDEGSDLSSQPESSEGSASSWSPDSQRAGRDMWLLAAEIWPAAAALASNACCATLLFPFFTFVTSSGRLGPLLPQVNSCSTSCIPMIPLFLNLLVVSMCSSPSFTCVISSGG